jgi:putative ABC transport system ATP-binding protein
MTAFTTLASPEVRAQMKALKAVDDQPFLACNDLHKKFGQTTALAGASFTMKAGEIVTLMGPSGSGKSTLMHCLAGVTRPDSGQVTYLGHDTTKMTDGQSSALRRREFGFIFQFGQLVPELTCIENVALPLRLDGVKGKEAKRRAVEWLGKLEVADVASKTPGEISGGQGQRVAVARSLVTGPRLVFADEPTGALDSLNGEKVMQLLTETARENNVGILLVTHEPRVAAYSDREVVIRDGKTKTSEL